MCPTCLTVDFQIENLQIGLGLRALGCVGSWALRVLANLPKSKDSNRPLRINPGSEAERCSNTIGPSFGPLRCPKKKQGVETPLNPKP